MYLFFISLDITGKYYFCFMNSNKNNGWLNQYQNNNPLVIAGPCSAETEEQVLAIAHQLKNSKVSIFRAGIWKPRTRPGGFEGIGNIGLPWLMRAKQETGLPMAVEVANAQHVELALLHDIDVLWIGARTTVNPFAVQEIANALQGTDKTILVKNPVNPDLSLWLGAVERVLNANIKNVGAIHRGFSSYEKTVYRNNPEWQIAIDFKNYFSEIPLICDPSHISGNRTMIEELSQKALDLNYNGLMIETHINPDEAWSDAAQQITPKKLLEIIEHLVIREKQCNKQDFQLSLQLLRNKIDEFDQKILDILSNRMKITDQIGVLKRENNVAILQNERWNEILNKMITMGKNKNLSEDFIIHFFKAIHQESIAHQEQVFKK